MNFLCCQRTHWPISAALMSPQPVCDAGGFVRGSKIFVLPLTLTSVVFLSTHVDRQGVDMSFTVCLFVCTVTDFSAKDIASGIKFCTAVHRRPRQGISYFCELCSPRSPKSDESDSARATPFGV